MNSSFFNIAVGVLLGLPFGAAAQDAIKPVAGLGIYEATFPSKVSTRGGLVYFDLELKQLLPSGEAEGTVTGGRMSAAFCRGPFPLHVRRDGDWILFVTIPSTEKPDCARTWKVKANGPDSFQGESGDLNIKKK